MKIICDCNDILDHITRNGGHYDFWTVEKWKEFKYENLSAWMFILEEILKKNKNGDEFYFGNKLTYADIAVFCVIEGLCTDCKQEKFITSKFPKLAGHY